jgi:hypothetical protein
VGLGVGCWSVHVGRSHWIHVAVVRKGSVESYLGLLVWQKSMDLVVKSYEMARLLPANEIYGLTSQIQRAAVSIPANIAEG